MSAIAGERLIFGQQQGNNLELMVFGDEYYARYATPDGFTVIYDLDCGQYCYAELREGHFASTGTPVSKPPPYGIRRHIKEEQTIRNTKFSSRFDGLQPREALLSASSNTMRTMGPNSGLLPGRQVARDNNIRGNNKVRGLTILVEFQDIHSTITEDDVNGLLNADNYTKNGNFCSVRQYFQMMSGGKLDYSNRVIGPIRLSQKQSYYINRLLVPEALELALSQHNLNLDDFDSLGEGILDAVNFMYAGRTLYAGNLWPHNSVRQMQIGNHQTHFYTLQSLGRSRIDLSIGTFAHESGHMLCRFPDLYDYGQRDGDFEKSSGLGRYCLMSSGNHLNRGKTPSPICTYLRDLAGWCDNEVILNNPGAHIAKHGDYSTAMRFMTDKPHEYFMIENRHQEGLDSFLPDAGLAVYHCDTRGSNEYQDGTPDKHYQCALIQADGLNDLEKSTMGGDSNDLFSAIDGVALSDTTLPHSREWDGSDSGLKLASISPYASEISFTIGDQVSINQVVGRTTADLIIPDNDAAGIYSPIAITQPGTLTGLRIILAISHTYRGDLNVRLEAPSGKGVVLHSNEGGYLNDLLLDLTMDSYPALKELQSEPIEGNWQLHVSDLAAADQGRLDSWEITLDYEATEHTSSAEISPNAIIPDADNSGIRSSIMMADSGNVKSIEVEVDITHSYRGDLHIELISPSGQHALLRSRNGDSRNDIHAIYSDQSTTPLQVMIGEEVEGEWTLHVRDLARQDQGTLEHWAITMKR